MRTIFLSVFLGLAALASPAFAVEPYVAAYLGSQHIGNDDLNNVNPGVTLGGRWRTRWPNWEVHAEAGVFYNSYEEVSPIALAGISRRVADIGPGTLRLGASIGTAYYRELSRELKDDYGIPNIGGFIPIVAVTASYRIDPVDIRVTTVPPGADTTAIVNLSVAISF